MMLASPRASFITGTNVVVDGALTRGVQLVEPHLPRERVMPERPAAVDARQRQRRPARRDPLRRVARAALRYKRTRRLMTSPPDGPVEWVAITFPGTTLGAGVAAFTKLGELRERGLLTEAEFAAAEGPAARMTRRSHRHRLPGRRQPHRVHRGGAPRGSSTARRSTSTTSSGSAAPRAARCARCWPGPRCARATATAPGRCSTAFWADNSASTPLDVAANAWLMWAATLQSTGWLPQVSPYDLPVDGLGEFRALLTRRVDFDRVHARPGWAAARRRRRRRAQRPVPGLPQLPRARSRRT